MTASRHQRPRAFRLGRATPQFHRLVYRIVRQVPHGKVVTYGQVAAILGHPRAARAVGQALRMLPPALQRVVPWQRVINAAGCISHRGDILRPDMQRARLESEGVRFDRRGKVDLRRLRWPGPKREWVTKLRHEFPFA
jgi:methylated-DNA-protein-cysteine methyltransferase-like protein